MSYKLLIEDCLRGVRQSDIMQVRSLRHLPSERLQSGVTVRRDWLYSLAQDGVFYQRLAERS